MKKQRPAESTKENIVEVDVSQINAKSFTFRELATATKNFRQECLLGEGGFGRVYKGTLQSTGQVITSVTLFWIYESSFFLFFVFYEDLCFPILFVGGGCEAT